MDIVLKLLSRSCICLSWCRLLCTNHLYTEQLLEGRHLLNKRPQKQQQQLMDARVDSKLNKYDPSKQWCKALLAVLDTG